MVNSETEAKQSTWIGKAREKWMKTVKRCNIWFDEYLNKKFISQTEESNIPEDNWSSFFVSIKDWYCCT